MKAVLKVLHGLENDPDYLCTVTYEHAVPRCGFACVGIPDRSARHDGEGSCL